MDRVHLSLELLNQVFKVLEQLPFNQVANLIQAIIKDVEGQKIEKAEEPKGEEKDV